MNSEIGWKTVSGNLHIILGRQKCWIGTTPRWVIVGKHTAQLLGALNSLSTKYQDAEYAEMTGKVNKIMMIIIITATTTTTTTIIIIIIIIIIILIIIIIIIIIINNINIINIDVNINIIITVLNHPVIVPLIIPSILPSPPPNTRSRRPLVLLVQNTLKITLRVSQVLLTNSATKKAFVLQKRGCVRNMGERNMLGTGIGWQLIFIWDTLLAITQCGVFFPSPIVSEEG